MPAAHGKDSLSRPLCCYRHDYPERAAVGRNLAGHESGEHESAEHGSVGHGSAGRSGLAQDIFQHGALCDVPGLRERQL